MRILLDESVPRKLKRFFPQTHDVYTVKERNLPYQQKMKNLPLTIVVLCAVNNRLETLAALLPAMFAKLNQVTHPTVLEVS